MIVPQFWDDERTASLSDGGCRLLAWLLTCDQADLCPGLVVAGPAAIGEAIRRTTEQVETGLAELTAAGLIQIDRQFRLIRIPNAPKFNVPGNGNVVRGWYRRWKKLPESQLKHDHVAALEGAVVSRKESHRAAWAETFGQAQKKQPLRVVDGGQASINDSLTSHQCAVDIETNGSSTSTSTSTYEKSFSASNQSSRAARKATARQAEFFGDHEKPSQPENEKPPGAREFFRSMEHASAGAIARNPFDPGLGKPYKRVTSDLWAEGVRMADCLEAAGWIGRGGLKHLERPITPKWFVGTGNLADAIAKAKAAKTRSRPRAGPAPVHEAPEDAWEQPEEFTRLKHAAAEQKTSA